MDKNEFGKLSIIVACSFLLHLAFITSHPFYLDEALYAEMIWEMEDHPTLVPMFFGYEAGWKPPMFFWTFAAATALTQQIFSNPEFAYRLPNVLFAMANVVLFHLLARKWLGKETAPYATAFYAFSALFLYTNERLLIDTLAVTFILGSICAYVELRGARRFALGGALLFFAVLTKSVVGFIVPAVAVAYFIQHERRELLNPVFILSLAAIPLALGVHYFSLSPEAAQGIFFRDMGGKVVGDGAELVERVGSSFMSGLSFLNALLVLSAAGLLLRWRENYAMAAWYALAVFPLLGGAFMAWYFYAVLPPMAFFATLLMAHDPKTGKTNIDGFFKFVFALVIGINILVSLLWFERLMDIGELKMVGEFLEGKKNVAFVGSYGAAASAVVYKALGERAENGSAEDFGWVIVPMNSINDTMIRDFALDYRTSKYEANEEDFERLFWSGEIFRKKTGVERFDWLVVSGPSKPEISCYSQVFMGDDLAIYQREC